MCLFFLAVILSMLQKRLRQFSKGRRQRIWFLIVACVIMMLLYELYVEYAVGHKYGIPTDDDTRWIFAAATALRSGSTVESLMYLTQNTDYDLANRALSFNNLGQYLYAFWVYAVVYLPTLFSVRVNLFILYVMQILLNFIVAIDLTNYLCKVTAKAKNEYFPFWGVFLAIVMCPLLLFNSFKLLRESWYLFFVVEAICKAENVGTRGSKKIVFGNALMAVLFRPLVIVLLAPVILYYCFDKHIGRIAAMAGMVFMIAAPVLLTVIARLVGWSYHIGTVSLPEMVHLLLFPNVFNQFNLLLEIGDNPSWITPFYFFMSVWNVIYVVIMAVGILFAEKKHLDRVFWLCTLINCIIIYTIPYNIENMTPRYKLLFFIPMMYFCTIAIRRIKIRFSKRI